jgi:hypothetical protein
MKDTIVIQTRLDYHEIARPDAPAAVLRATAQMRHGAD